MMKKSFFALLACALVFACQPDDPEKGKKPQDDEKKPGPEVVDYTPQPGTYTYEELIDALKETFYADFDVNYAYFTPETGEDLEQVLAELKEKEQLSEHTQEDAT